MGNFFRKKIHRKEKKTNYKKRKKYRKRVESKMKEPDWSHFLSHATAVPATVIGIGDCL